MSGVQVIQQQQQQQQQQPSGDEMMMTKDGFMDKDSSDESNYDDGIGSEESSDAEILSVDTSRRNSETENEDEYSVLRRMADLCIEEALKEGRSRDNKMCQFSQPEILQKFLAPMLQINDEAASTDDMLEACSEFIKHSVKTTMGMRFHCPETTFEKEIGSSRGHNYKKAHPRFFNQLYGGMDINSLAGAWLTEALNSSLYTYEVAPVFTIMEREIYKKMLNLVGFDGGEGIFVPGGSIGNLYGINVARYYKFPEVKTKGLFGLKKPLCLFTSEKCHYSIAKAAFTLGLGTDAVFSVKTDARGKMLPEDLENQVQKSIEQGYEPFYVNCTCGTTVYGAFDPIEKIADVCEKYGLWLHVDGAYGGSVALSRKHRHLLKGSHRADSMVWNPHKMMGASQQCSVFLTKHKGVVGSCHSAHAKYLFQKDKHYDVSYDSGDMSLQCGRRNDVLKLWMLWKGRGDKGLDAAIDHLFDLSKYLSEKVKNTEGFRLLLEPESCNVCFWYIPPSMRNQEENEEWYAKLHQVAPKIKAKMMERGSMMITYNPEGDYVNFFRMVLSNFDTTFEDMDFLIREFIEIGKDM